MNTQQVFQPHATMSLNQEAKEHLPYDNPRDPYASQDRLPSPFGPRTFDADSENISDLVAEVPMPSAEQMRVGELALDAFYDGTKDADVQGACAHIYRAMRALE